MIEVTEKKRIILPPISHFDGKNPVGMPASSGGRLNQAAGLRPWVSHPILINLSLLRASTALML